MATFTVSTAQNFNALVGRTGGDILNINGGTLTIDSDTFSGLNSTGSNGTNTSIAATTISATQGGSIIIDGTNVWEVQVAAQSITTPALGSTITQGGVSAILLGWCDNEASGNKAGTIRAPLAVTANGWLKFKNMTGGTFTTGAITCGALTFTATTTPVRSCIQIVGDQAGTMTIPRLGSFTVNGDWYDCGVTTGLSTTIYAYPVFGRAFTYPAVYVETGVGTGIYEAYAATQSAATDNIAKTLPNDARAKVCCPMGDTSGRFTIGGGPLGASICGYTPTAGRKIRVPNVQFVDCTTASRSTNALPSATLTTRYKFATTGGGNISITNAAMCWYPVFAQAFSVSLTNVAIADQISVSEIASPMTWSGVAVGCTSASTTVTPQTALIMSLCNSGSTFNKCVFQRSTMAAATAFTTQITDCKDLYFNTCTLMGLAVRSNAAACSASLLRAYNINYTNCIDVNAGIIATSCNGINLTNHTYVDVPTGVTATTAAQNTYVLQVSNGTSNVKIDGLSFGGLTQVQPYLGIIGILAAGCSNIKLRNIGTQASPLDLGVTNGSAYIVNIAAAANASNIYVQRVYCINTRSGSITSDNSSSNIVFENSGGDYADAATITSLNTQLKGFRGSPATTVQTAQYGTHFYDTYTGANGGYLQWVFNEKTGLSPSSTAYTITSGTPAFNSAGMCTFLTVGGQIEYTSPYWIYGCTGFNNSSPTIVQAGGSFTQEYAIDRNNGAGYGAYKPVSAVNLFAEAALSPTLGFKIKLRLTCLTVTTAGTPATISSYQIALARNEALSDQYPLDTATGTLTGLISGSDVVILQAGTTTILQNADSIAATTYDYQYSGSNTIDIGVLKAGYVPLYIRNYSIGASGFSIPIAQVVDRNYS